MRIILGLFLCLFLMQTSAVSMVTTENNYNITSKELSQIEKQVFGKTFNKDTPEVRIIRLEVNLLGAAQNGALDKRLQTILTAANNLDNNYYDTMTNTPTYTSSWSTTTPSTQNGFWNGVKNLFSTNSYMTGYTPPISPYGYNTPYGFSPNPFYSGYNSPHMNYPSTWNKYYRSNSRYYNSNRNFGTGTGVHILD